MSLPKISIINFSEGLSDREAQSVIRAVNRQVLEDFLPAWGVGRELILHASAFDPTHDEDVLKEDNVRASAVLYLVNEGTVEGAAGYHALNNAGVPYGFVYTDISGDDWSITLSHEVLELVVDPNAMTFVPGPDPDPAGQGKMVWHTYEVCDAVERTFYYIDDVAVSNFITPAYFTEGDEAGTRNDFLGLGVTSFGALLNCHLTYYDMDEGWKTYYGDGSASTSNAINARRSESMAQGSKNVWPCAKTMDRIVSNNAAINGVSRSTQYQAAMAKMK